jgi:hypothetical protein
LAAADGKYSQPVLSIPQILVLEIELSGGASYLWQRHQAEN